MCRFVYYQGEPLRLAELLTEPEHSLIHQSFHSHQREEPLNGDGFGVSWYVEKMAKPALFRSISPAWSNDNLREISRVVTSRRILAHVRAATPGTGVAEANCHPFRMGDLAFMHNGELGGFSSYRRSLLHDLSDDAFHAVRGATDSEHFFALVWDAFREGARNTDPTDADSPLSRGAEGLAVALETALGRLLELRERSAVQDDIYLNCLLTDGRNAVACRYTTDRPAKADSLYMHRGKRYTSEGGRAAMVSSPEDRVSVVLSSEPLTPDEDWSPVEVGDLVLISEDRTVRHRRLVPT